MPPSAINEEENHKRMLAGELYYAFAPNLAEARRRCEQACGRFNTDRNQSRRECVEQWREIIGDSRTLPAAAATPEEDEKLLEREPYICRPVRIDYGTNVQVGSGVFINFNCTILDTCTVRIGARTLIGPNTSIYTATHPEDPTLRDGVNGPESGRPVSIGEDVWIAGNVTILPGVSIGRGAVIGAGSVVTRDVPAHWVAVGNPARLLRRVKMVDGSQADAEALPPRQASVAITVHVGGTSASGSGDYVDEDQGW